MSPKQPSKQKRAAQNRNQRAARAARAANANRPASISGGGGGTGGGGGLLSRLRGGGGRTTTRGGTTRPTLAEARSLQPPGFRAALSAVFAALAAIVLCTFALRYPVDAQGDLYTRETLVADWTASALDVVAEQPDATADEVAQAVETWAPGREQETVVAALWPWSVAIVLPLLGAGLTFWAVRRRSPSRVLNRALYATLFGAVLTQGLLLLFIPVVLAVGVAMFQVRKAEAVAAASGADGVIDVAAEDTTVEDTTTDEADDEDEPDVAEPEIIDAMVVEREADDPDGAARP